MRTLKQHLLGVVGCSVGAAIIGFGALFIFDYGFSAAPASISRRFIDHGFHAVHSIITVFFAPVFWLSPRSGSWVLLASILAALIWGSVSYTGLRLLIFAAHRVHPRRLPIA
jgi:hypothetical protein